MPILNSSPSLSRLCERSLPPSAYTASLSFPHNRSSSLETDLCRPLAGILNIYSQVRRAVNLTFSHGSHTSLAFYTIIMHFPWLRSLSMGSSGVSHVFRLSTDIVVCLCRVPDKLWSVQYEYCVIVFGCVFSLAIVSRLAMLNLVLLGIRNRLRR